MYFPFLRGKQNELFAIRELAASIVNQGGVIPIIEPVNANSVTNISLDRFVEANLPFIFITNPLVGRLSEHPGSVESLWENVEESDQVTPALLVNESTLIGEITAFKNRFSDRNVTYIYMGEPSGTALVEELLSSEARFHVFNELTTSLSFRHRFSSATTVLLNDSFKRCARNADYPDNDFFSDKHLISGIAGFSDFSIVGAGFTEGRSGAAHAVTLHHMHFQENGDAPLYVRHFISDRTEDSSDQGGKFLEALQKLVDFLPAARTANHGNVTDTCSEYLALYGDEHFPGLGAAKKLAIKHHIQLFLN